MKMSESASSSDLRENHEAQSDRELIFTTLENSHTQCNNLCDVESRNGTARRSQAVKSPANRCGVFLLASTEKKKGRSNRKSGPYQKHQPYGYLITSITWICSR